MPQPYVNLRASLHAVVEKVGVHRLFIALLGLWTAANLAAAGYSYWTVQHSVVCIDQDGTGPFCRYRLMTNAISAAGGWLKVLVIGVVILDVAWLVSMIRSEG